MISLAGRRLGEGEPALLVAEVGLNHNGDPALAERMIRESAAAGADAVKFQAFTADRLCSRLDAAYATLGGRSPHALFASLELPLAEYPRLMAAGREAGVIVTATPFDETSASQLAELGVVFLKIASGDLTNLPLLSHVGSLGLPVALSTGMGDMEEIAAALAALATERVVLLQCTSAYPCPPDQVDLRAMVAMRERFGRFVGLSDHTEGFGAAAAAAALGAVMIEKHFTCDRELPGPDQKMSLDPAGFRRMVTAIREAEAALGSAEKRPRAGERGTAPHARRSLYAARPLAAGATLTAADIIIKRPAVGLSPARLAATIGRRLRRALAPDEPIREEDLL